MPQESRRPLRSRSTAWARGLATRLATSGVTPNSISATSVVFAALGGLAFIASGQHWLPWPFGWLLGAVMIQLRLICNLMDGMVAIEGGRKSATGDLWNEIPDRFADALLLVGAGLCLDHWWIGALAAWASVMTAYVRSTGAELTGQHDFCGPFAKPQRMATLTLAAIVTAFDGLPTGNPRIMTVALIVISAGTLLTVFRRILRLAYKLRPPTS